jgi:hypothetical protein
MMQKIIASFLVCLSLLFLACEKEFRDEIIPFTLVNEDLNLTNLQYLSLKNTGGYVYLNEAGYSGIIIYNEGNGFYRAFDRACTFDPRSGCDPVIVDPSGLFMKHICCNSSFDFTGAPLGGPASLRLLEYRTFVDGNYLKITNK